MHFGHLSRRPENTVLGLKLDPIGLEMISNSPGRRIFPVESVGTIYLAVSAKMRKLWLIFRFLGVLKTPQKRQNSSPAPDFH